MTVSLFSGTAFFAAELDTTGLQLIEAAFEFGGNFAMDVGVASGAAYLYAGIYFKLEKNTSESFDVTLEGYVRCGGHLSILGLIKISCEFYLGITYELKDGKSRVWGRASLKVEIEIIFFSITVSVEVEKTFAGSGDSSASLPGLDGTRLASTDSGAMLAQLRRGGGATTSLVPEPEPPGFTDLMDKPTWQEYCAAFA